jgi:putative membrane protein
MASWVGLAGLVGLQIAYPLSAGATRAGLVVATVVLGYALSVGHALATRGWRTAGILVAVTTGGGLAAEMIGLATGFPFGAYHYSDALGPTLLGLPMVIPLAWTWMAWPAWLAAVHLVRGRLARTVVAAAGLSTWDLFLDPQMVHEGYWHWPGGGVPTSNYLGWFGVSLIMMALLRALPSEVDLRADAPMLALYLWTYLSSVLAHAVFLDLPASAVYGGLGMGVVAVWLMVRLVRA